MQQPILCTLIALAAFALAADASAIKGHERPRQAEVAQQQEATKSVGARKAAAPAPVAILENPRRISQDASFRRLASLVEPQQQQPALVAEPIRTIEGPAVPVQAASAVSVQAAPAVPVVEPAKSVDVPVVVAVQAAPVAPAVAPVQSTPVEQVVPAVVEPRSAVPVVVPAVAVAPAAAPAEVVAKEEKPVAKVDELPVQSERSASPVAPQLEQVRPVVEPIVAPVVVVAPQAPVVPVAAPVESPVVPVAVAEPVKVVDSPLQARKDEAGPAPVVAPVVVAAEKPVAAPEPLHIEVPAPDPGLVLSEPIDSTTKLLIDLDEHVQKFLPAEDQQPARPAKDQQLVAGVDYSPASQVEPSGKSSGPLVPYSGAGDKDEPIVPPLPSLEGVEKASGAQVAPAPVSSSASSAAAAAAVAATSASSPSATRQGGQHQNQIAVIHQLLSQLDSLEARIQDTINQLTARRRYVMSALLRPMGTYVRRVRTNLERLQNRVNQLQAAASSVGGGQNRPGGFVDAAAIETIRRRIDDISKRISDIVNRIRFSLTPTSAPMNSNGRK